MSQTTLFDFAQRWREQHARWVCKRQTVDVRTLEAAMIPDDTTAKAFVETHHYSGSYPAARARVGLYQRGELVGVAIFSQPMNNRVIPKWLGLDNDEGAELGRFVLLDEVGYNAETWFLAQAFRLVRRERGWRGVLAYSDPVMRSSLDGDVVLPGHVGTIYQAHNGRYLGRSSSRRLLLDADGRVLSPRTLSKIRNDERGHEYATAQLVELGAPERLVDEPGAHYVKRALTALRLRAISHPGNHCYAWPLDKRLKMARGLSYPKQIEEVEIRRAA